MRDILHTQHVLLMENFEINIAIMLELCEEESERQSETVAKES